MRTIRHSACLVFATFLLVSCATLPPDGDAVECAACDALWIRLLPATGAAGVYRMKHEERPEPCARCEKLSASYFRTGEIPTRCPQCGGRLLLRPVNVTR